MTVSHGPVTVRPDCYSEAFALSDAVVVCCHAVLSCLQDKQGGPLVLQQMGAEDVSSMGICPDGVSHHFW